MRLRLDALLKHLDAQERRLEKFYPISDPTIADYHIVTHDGDELLPFDDDRPEGATLVSIVVIPSGKFLKAADANYGVEREYRAVPTGETYEVDTGNFETLIVPRHQIFVAPVLLDPPPEPIIAGAQVAEKVVEHATGSGERRPVRSAPALFDDKAAFASIVARREEAEEEIVAQFKRKPFTNVNAWVQDQLAVWGAIGRI